MALSDHEQKLFDQLEKQLRDDDPRLAAALAPAPARASTVSNRRIVLGVLADLAGFLTLLIAVMLPDPTTSILVGILGFTTMGAGIYFALANATPGPRFREAA